eukprot:7386799-Prymnesium_polylepis.2
MASAEPSGQYLPRTHGMGSMVAGVGHSCPGGHLPAHSELTWYSGVLEPRNPMLHAKGNAWSWTPVSTRYRAVPKMSGLCSQSQGCVSSFDGHISPVYPVFDEDTGDEDTGFANYMVSSRWEPVARWSGKLILDDTPFNAETVTQTLNVIQPLCAGCVSRKARAV